MKENDRRTEKTNLDNKTNKTFFSDYVKMLKGLLAIQGDDHKDAEFGRD